MLSRFVISTPSPIARLTRDASARYPDTNTIFRNSCAVLGALRGQYKPHEHLYHAMSDCFSIPLLRRSLQQFFGKFSQGIRLNYLLQQQYSISNAFWQGRLIF
jgi:hypothetical protein